MTKQSSISKSIAAHTATAPAPKKATKPKKSPARTPVAQTLALPSHAIAELARSTPIDRSKEPKKGKPKAKKAPLIPVKLTLAMSNAQIRSVVECAADGSAENYSLSHFPVKIDDLLRNPKVIAALTKAVTVVLDTHLATMDEESDVLDEVSGALESAYRKELIDAEEKEQARRAEETTTLTIPRSKKAQIERLLRDKGLL